MPGFGSLDDGTAQSVVAYLRRLQGKSEAARLAGDMGKGRALFFGKGQCSQCHMIAGQGGFIASDLSMFGVTRSGEEIRDAIVRPNSVRPNNGGRRGGSVMVTTKDGHKYSGVLRNEDNFSLQLQSLDGEFHLFAKAEIDSVTRAAESLMPTDYGSTLAPGELDDLIAFLASSATPERRAAASKKKSKQDEGEEEE